MSTASISRRTPALERRFQMVLVGEPSVEDTIGILRGLKEKHEAHHKVAIADAALVAAAALSDRYITSRFLPDKAIDLIDESASRLRMEIDSRLRRSTPAAFRGPTEDGRDGRRPRNGRSIEGTPREDPRRPGGQGRGVAWPACQVGSGEVRPSTKSVT